MDFNTFLEKLTGEDLKPSKPTASMLSFIDSKYSDKELLGTYRLHDNFSVTHFKQKLWQKLAFFNQDAWVETRINSLKNKLPEEVLSKSEKSLKKKIQIQRIESVISADQEFYYYVIAKISSKKKVLHINRAGEILLNTKYVEHIIRLSDEDSENDNEKNEMDIDIPTKNL